MNHLVKKTEKFDLIYSAVMSIPAGNVATYGQIAEYAGLPGRARLVGYALRCLPTDSGVPWHRVVNAAGRISNRDDLEGEFEQRFLLEAEGVEFSAGNTVRMRRYRWDPFHER